MNELLSSFNNTKLLYPNEKTMHELFAEQAGRSQNATALMYQEDSITYRSLNSQSSRLARKLRSYGVKPDTIVALMVNRSIEMMIGILGILKAGGCYLPVDPSYPEARIRYMLEDSKTAIMLTRHCDEKVTGFQGRILYLDDEYAYDHDASDLDNINTAKDLVYVIYTSGSTGKPKGVMIEHRAMHNFIRGMREIISFESKKTISCLTTISFDIFALESLLPLTVGMKVIIADPMRFSREVGDKKVDMLQTTPSTMQLLLGDELNHKIIGGLSEIMLGGEPFPLKLLNKLKKLTGARIYNMYGPTETTVWSTVKELTQEENITIGKPIANTQVYILDEAGQALPADTIGELCIAGDGVARGYLNQPELTRKRFIDNPKSLGERMYKTGDLAKLLPEGDLAYIGRVDSQVKVRGFRIELGEIEESLMLHDKIDECVVAAKSNSMGEKYLVAYYVSSEDLPISGIIEFLGKSIPNYMIPGFYMRINRIPLMPNGKVDRTSLPEPGRGRALVDTDYAAPETAIEKQVVDIWRSVLNCDLIGINDNFFELGGNSILISQLFLQLEKCCPAGLDIADVFAYPSVAKQVELIVRRQHAGELKKDIEPLRLPVNYYMTDKSGPSEVMLKSRIPIQDCSRLDNIDEFGEKGRYAMMIAAYMYILSEVSGQQQIQVAVMPGESSRINRVSVDFDNIKELADLCKAIYIAVYGSDENNTVLVKDLERSINRNQNGIIPVFHIGMKETDSRFARGALTFGVTEYNADMLFRASFSTFELNKDRVEKLFRNYLELIKSLIMEI